MYSYYGNNVGALQIEANSAMELQEGCVRFGRGDGDSASQVTCKVLLIEFKRLQTALGEQTKLQTQTEVRAAMVCCS